MWYSYDFFISIVFFSYELSALFVPAGDSNPSVCPSG
uniref:Uncharacterized protein n=1 Tax=Myoviridae sp. ctOoC8 TaxID=2823542 RepID=A0A8S5L6C3_9CAUD|nr:MAG TPA: hypothetical protein [Myoviridae sp. ctOoC8]